MFNFMLITKALADENRVRVLFALKGRELCVCQIISFLGLAPSTVSKHMSILKQAGLVEDRKDGRWVYYRLAGDKTSPEVKAALVWVYQSLSKSEKIQQDIERLKEILKKDPKELCKN